MENRDIITMEIELIRHKIYNYETESGILYRELTISYQLFGKKLHSAPLVLINHALTGNSDIASDSKGWWKTIVGHDKLIDLNHYTVISFNILGNGYDGSIIEKYKDFNTKDVARLFIQTLQEIGVKSLYAAMGGSLGGGIAWEMAVLEPQLIQNLIPIASDWKSTDWIIGHNYIQDQLLHNSKTPLEDARMMAMLFYRTPASMGAKFKRTRTKDNQQFKVESWLSYHGQTLVNRFDLSAYKMMNHLLTTIDISRGEKTIEEVLSPIQSRIIQIAIDTDLFFVKEENLKTQKVLNQLNINNQYHEIKSIHGHDAFLIEYEQLTQFLQPVFNNKN